MGGANISTDSSDTAVNRSNPQIRSSCISLHAREVAVKQSSCHHKSFPPSQPTAPVAAQVGLSGSCSPP